MNKIDIQNLVKKILSEVNNPNMSTRTHNKPVTGTNKYFNYLSNEQKNQAYTILKQVFAGKKDAFTLDWLNTENDKLLGFISNALIDQYKKAGDQGGLKLKILNAISYAFNPTISKGARKVYIQSANKWVKDPKKKIDPEKSHERADELLRHLHAEYFNGEWIDRKFLPTDNGDSFLGYMIKVMGTRLADKIRQKKVEPEIKKRISGHVNRRSTTTPPEMLVKIYGLGHPYSNKFPKVLDAFNKATTEAFEEMKDAKVNKKSLAAFDGIVRSKLNTEELLKAYPDIFHNDKALASAAFARLKGGKTSSIINNAMIRHGLDEIPPVSKWKSKDFVVNQNTLNALPKDDFGGIFELFIKNENNMNENVLRNYIKRTLSEAFNNDLMEEKLNELEEEEGSSASVRYGKDRKSPSISATDCNVGDIETGNDDEDWVVKADKNGVNHWKSFSDTIEEGMGITHAIKRGQHGPKGRENIRKGALVSDELNEDDVEEGTGLSHMERRSKTAPGRESTTVNEVEDEMKEGTGLSHMNRRGNNSPKGREKTTGKKSNKKKK